MNGRGVAGGGEGAAIVSIRDVKGQTPGPVGDAHVDPSNAIFRLDEVLNMYLEIVLGFKERVFGIGKILEC